MASPDKKGSTAGGRFPESGRRRVAGLPKTRSSLGFFFFLLYAAGAAVAAPFVLRWQNWYTNDLITDVGPYFCAGILLLPMIGFWAGLRLLRRCAVASRAAAAVDLRTQGLFDDNATLQSKARETLAQDYDTHATTSSPIVNALRSDALRRAFVDRWEPSNWLVDAYRDQLGKGLPLITTLQRMALQLGILFTFIGLAVAFSSDAFRMSADVKGIPNMEPLVTALQVKFMASIAGLVSSVSLLGLGWACRREVTSAVSRLEAMVDNILTLAKTMRSDPGFASDIAELRVSVQRLDSRVEGLQHGYHSVVAAVTNGIQDLTAARVDFEKKLADLLASQQSVVAEIDAFYSRVSPQGLADHLGTVLDQHGEAFSQKLKSTTQAVNDLNDAVLRLAAAERLRAQDDSTVEERHKELVHAVRSLLQRPGWGGQGVTGGRSAR